MKRNIILQHWHGPLDELTQKSSQSMRAYAEMIGADYEFVRGIHFKPRIAHKLQLPCQKMIMLDERYDSYENVCMVDADIFPRAGVKDNVFVIERGIGRHTQIQTEIRENMITWGHRNNIRHGTDQTPYWGGAVFMLSLEVRQAFRKVLDDQICLDHARSYHDEGIMFGLAGRLGVTESDKEFLGQPIYMDGQGLDYSSYDQGIENAKFIHIREKITPTGPKRTKLENYNDLVERGLITPC